MAVKTMQTRSSRRSAAALLLLLSVTLTSLTSAAWADEQRHLKPTRTTSSDEQPTVPPAQLHQCSSDDGNADSCVQRADGLQKRQEQDGDDDEPAQSSSRPNVPQNAPNGGLSMTQPPITAQATVRLLLPVYASFLVDCSRLIDVARASFVRSNSSTRSQR